MKKVFLVGFEELSMDFRKVCGIAAIIAIIGFVLMACSSPAATSTPDTHAHVWGNWVTITHPTCTTAGMELRVCQHEDCDGIETRNVDINPDAHVYGEWMVINDAGESIDGKEKRLCVHCDAMLEERILHHLGTEGLVFERLAGEPPRYRITGLTGISSTVVIPTYRNDAPVVYIASGALGHRGLTDITIGNNVTHIESLTFIGNQLTSVTIPDSVTHIGGNAFSRNQLTKVTIGNNVIIIDGNAFSNNQLLYVSIPDSVTHIGNQAFQHNQLTDVIIGNNIAYIWFEAFANNQLTSISIPDSVTHISLRAFGDNQLTTVTIPSHTQVNPEAFDPGVTIIRR